MLRNLLREWLDQENMFSRRTGVYTNKNNYCVSAKRLQMFIKEGNSK